MGVLKKYFMAFLAVLVVFYTGCGTKGQDEDPIVERSSVNEAGTDKALFVSLDLDDILAEKESEAAVPVRLTKNDGFTGIGLEITYDNTKLEFQGIDLDGKFSRHQSIADCTEVPKSNIVHASYVFDGDIHETGQFAVVRFTVRKDAADSLPADVYVGIRELVRTDEKQVSGNEKCVQVRIGE